MQDADKAETQISLSHSLNVLGNMLFASGDFKGALNLSESLDVMRRLGAKDPNNVQRQLGTITPLLGLAGAETTIAAESRKP